MRSVTRAIVGCRLLMPAHPVSLGQGDSGAWTPASRIVRPGRQALAKPLLANRIDPSPLRLHLIAANEKSLVAFEQVKQQTLVGDAPLRARKRVGNGDIERHLAQGEPLAVEPRYLGHQR